MKTKSTISPAGVEIPAAVFPHCPHCGTKNSVRQDEPTIVHVQEVHNDRVHVVEKTLFDGNYFECQFCHREVVYAGH